MIWIFLMNKWPIVQSGTPGADLLDLVPPASSWRALSPAPATCWWRAGQILFRPRCGKAGAAAGVHHPAD